MSVRMNILTMLFITAVMLVVASEAAILTSHSTTMSKYFQQKPMFIDEIIVSSQIIKIQRQSNSF
jgi:hypothetical protein